MSDAPPKLSGAQALYPLSVKPEDLHRAATYQARQIERSFEAQVANHKRIQLLEGWKKEMETKHAVTEERTALLETDNKIRGAVDKRTMALFGGLIGLISFLGSIVAQVLMHH